MLRILVLEPEYLDADAMRILKTIGQVSAKRMKRSELMRKIGGFDIIVVRIEEKLDAELLSHAKKLKAIGSATTGLNHIDLHYAKRMGIKVFNLHGAHTAPTAQHAVALMLALMRNIPWAYESLRQGKWNRYEFIGSELDGKRLGIIGLGRIGNTVCRYAKAFGMEVVYYDPYVHSRLAKRVSLNRLLSTSDVITVHAALNRSSSNELNSKEMSMIKRGAFLVNTARAQIMDYGALLRALRSGRIRGAALDVFANEPVSRHERKLLEYSRKNRNLLVTPHIAASTHEAAYNAGIEIAKDLAREFTKKRS